MRNYSLGMRQRLGIATALIGDPEVLILDEPANGLDPAGIRWMRDLLRSYADQGGTVLLSSHLLHEIEVIADDLVVIGNGRIVAQGTKAELLAGRRDRRTHAGRRATSPARWTAPASRPPSSADGAVRTDADPERVGQVALAAGIALTELRSADGAGLEEMFLELTADTTTRRSSSMTTITVGDAWPATSRDRAPTPPPIPMSRVIGVELRKMFDTRSGFWLMTSIAITAVLATGAVILFAPDSELTYDTSRPPSAFPMSVILPMIAILSVTSEWSQRSGLTTFTLVPHRGRVIGAKASRRVASASSRCSSRSPSARSATSWVRRSPARTWCGT